MEVSKLTSIKEKTPKEKDITQKKNLQLENVNKFAENVKYSNR